MHIKTWNNVKWTMPVIKDLIDTLKEYTAIMEFNNSDLDDEEPRQYEEVSYDETPHYFWTTIASENPAGNLLTKTDDKRINNKIKELRVKVTNAVTVGKKVAVENLC